MRRHKIGVLVPYTNTNLEPDLQAMCPQDCTLHFERLGDYDIDQIPDTAQMAGLGTSDISESLRLICGVRPAAVLYGCTSATLTHGSDFDHDLAQKIAQRAKAASLTAAGALSLALQALGVTRIGFASPYLGEVNAQAKRFFAEKGIQTTRSVDIGKALGNYGQGELSPQEVEALALRAEAPEVQAIVLSCTDMRAVEVIDAVERATGKPVVTSNQALIFALCRALQLPRPAYAPGQLFSVL